MLYTLDPQQLLTLQLKVCVLSPMCSHFLTSPPAPGTMTQLSVILIFFFKIPCMGFPGASDGKESTCIAGDLGSISGLGRSPGGGQGNRLQYSCLENHHGQRNLVGSSPWGCRVRYDTIRYLFLCSFQCTAFQVLPCCCTWQDFPLF